MESFPSLNGKINSGEMFKPEFGLIELDLESKTLRNKEGGKTEQLQPQEYQILWMLIRARGNLIAEDDMVQFLYDDMPDDKDLPITNVIPARIMHLRKKLDIVSGGQIKIQNRRGVGYWLELQNENS